MPTALVFSEDLKLLPDLITGASKAKLGEINVCIISENIDESYVRGLGRYGAKNVYVFSGEKIGEFTTLQYENILSTLIKEIKPNFVIIGGTLFGNEIASMLASELNAPVATEVIDISLKDGELFVRRGIYGGKLVQDLKLKGDPKIIVIAPGAFESEEISSEEASFIKKDIPTTSEVVKVVEKESLVGKGKPLEEAEIVIGVGRGLKEKDDLNLIRKLAELLNAEIGCTRPLAADYGWFDEWIGISGKRIRPKLYLAIGISGSIQHMAGVRASKVIIAINKDEEAPILEEADYLFVADLYKLVPEIIKALERSKST